MLASEDPADRGLGLYLLFIVGTPPEGLCWGRSYASGGDLLVFAFLVAGMADRVADG